MAAAVVNATTIWEVETGGADTNTGGGFDPTATFGADLSAVNGNTATPTVSSASYNFQARDNAARLFIGTATNWTSGWYQITNVASNNATVNATLGVGVAYPQMRATTLTGVSAANNSTPTAGAWSIDYSQKAGSAINYTDLIVGVTNTTYTSALNPVGFNVVGNVLNVISGVGATVQLVEVISVSGTTATCKGGLGVAASNANAFIGGAFGSPGYAGNQMVGGNWVYLKAANYAIASNTNNVTTGCLSLPAGSAASQASKALGYNTVRGDYTAQPVINATTTTNCALISAAGSTVHIENITLNGNSGVGNKGFVAGAFTVTAYLMNFQNLVNAITSSAAQAAAAGCYATNSSGAAFAGMNYIGCVAAGGAATGFSGFASGTSCIDCLSINNTGSSNGFSGAGGNSFINCTAYNNATDGFASTTGGTFYVNCLAVQNGVFGYIASGPQDNTYLINCAAWNNTSGATNTAAILPHNLVNFLNLSGNPFTNAANNDFSLNLTTGAGAALRSLGFPGVVIPGTNTNTYPDIGAAQTNLALTNNITNCNNCTNVTNASNAVNVVNASNATNVVNASNAVNVVNASNAVNVTNASNVNQAVNVSNATNVVNSSGASSAAGGSVIHHLFKGRGR